MLEEPPEELLFSTELRTGLTHILSPRFVSLTSISPSHILSHFRLVLPGNPRTGWGRGGGSRGVCVVHTVRRYRTGPSPAVWPIGGPNSKTHSCARRAVWKTFLNQYNKQA